MSWTDRFMDVPFVRGGRSRTGADCYGLYLLVLTEAAGASISPFIGLAFGSEAAAVIDAEIASGRWPRIVVGAPGDKTLPTRAKAAAQKFDAVLMSAHVKDRDGVTRRADLHIGCATGDGRMLHSEAPHGPELIAIDDPSIAHRIRGVYRPAILAERAA